MADIDDEILADGAPDLLEEAGEPVTYIPGNGDPERDIELAIVDRRPPERSGPGGMVAHKIEITVANGTITGLTAGISSDEVDTGLDKIRVAMKVGDDEEERPIAAVVFQGGGLLVLGIG